MANEDELKGKLKEGVGKVTGDDSKELEGKAQGFFGKAKDAVENAVDDAAEKVNDVVDKFKDKDKDKK